jgi:hypothetical protein
MMLLRNGMFDVPIYTAKATNQKLVKEYFADTIIPNLPKSPNAEQLNLYSDYFPGADKLDDEFLKFYNTDIEKFHLKAGFNKNISWNKRVHAWYNVGSKGQMQEEHDHMGGYPSCIYSAIHYVIYDKDEHTPTVFKNPLYAFYGNSHMTKNSNNLPYDWKRLHIPQVQEGDLIFFPSFVPHSVSAQTSEKLRATVALNLYTHEETNV